MTDLATWLVADSALSDGWTPSSVAIVASPGRIVPLRKGNIAVHVRMATDHVVAPHTYAVDPTAPATTSAPYLSGAVTELDGGAPIAMARVEIIDGGIDTGKSDQTRGNGVYVIEHIRMAVPLNPAA